ncbi:MAG: GAF domain-containing sensor histidine kinase [Chloroflexi bacterium]|nr:GAF domain-containing sensor histidine kinase [Chloroflexota bacterium]
MNSSVSSNEHNHDDRCTAMLDALSRAAAAITSELNLPRTLKAITDIARELVGARYAALGVPEDDGTLKAFITSGMDAEFEQHVGPEPVGHGLLGAVLESDEPIRLDDLTQDPRSVGFSPGHPVMQRFLGVPIISRGERLGNLYLTDPLDGEPFSADDERLIVLLADQAAVAIENARLSEQLQTIALSRERDRIGMELHDGVIQSVYAVGMKLEIMRGQFAMTPEQEAQYHGIINDLNHIIEDIRLYIRNLRSARDEQATFKQRLENLARHFRDFARVDVIVDVPTTLRTLTDKQRHSLTQIGREGLSNVARHAHASQVRVTVREADNNLLLTVEDNGVGFDPVAMQDPESFGLQNMEQRARRLGGTFSIESGTAQGTLLIVKVPFRP